MKYFLNIFFAILLAGSLMGQDIPSYLKNKNDAEIALKNKKHSEALELFEKAIAEWSPDVEKNGELFFNAATCARRLDLDEKAIELYQQSQELGYKEDICAYYKASALKSLNRNEEMEAVLKKSIEDTEPSVSTARKSPGHS